MPSDLAIQLTNVSKVYHLHGNRRDQFVHVMGLDRLGIKPRSAATEFKALDNVSLDVSRGQRIGIIGRNGAGKTTLLKLICGNFTPTSGSVMVSGTVQALLSAGIGFHPEYTGRENIEASLHYNNLSCADYSTAIADIIEFAELGEFIDQPFKTYSLGMQARLMFAASTAIKPDILIVDEVLGAGDAYFVAKSKKRVEQMISKGCTLLLVSHSTAQILELCQQAVWIDNGAIVSRGDAFSVVKAYEHYIHGVSNASTDHATSINDIESDDPRRSRSKDLDGVKKEPHIVADKSNELPINTIQTKQEPLLQPRALPPSLHIPDNTTKFHNVAKGGISRWKSDIGVKVAGFSIRGPHGQTNKLTCFEPAEFTVTIKSEIAGHFRCRYGLLVDNLQGAAVAKIFSGCDSFFAEANSIRKVTMTLNPVAIGPGEYTLGISVLEYDALERINNARRYDLLSRSFSFSVALPESLAALSCQLFHGADWCFGV